VLINDIPSWRVDHMPYGGVKQSGHGREGIRWAIEDMTEPRLLVLTKSLILLLAVIRRALTPKNYSLIRHFEQTIHCPQFHRCSG
jgi:hypothetical protein